jgi:hypothetical protein
MEDEDSDKQRELELLEEELTERVDLEAASEEEEEVEAADARVPKKRGRPRIPIQWSRVMVVEPGEGVKMETRRLDFDLSLADALSRPDPGRRESDWEPFFHPKVFALEHDIEELEAWRLPEVLLKRYARLTTDLRKRQRERALRHVEQNQGVLSEADASVLRLQKAM